MDTILSQLAQARKEAIQRNEPFVRMSMDLLADVTMALMGGVEPKKKATKREGKQA